MSFNRLIGFVDVALSTNRSVVIDGTTFERLTQRQITREVANEAAWTISHQRRHFVASAEAFLNNETHEIIRVYLVCAVSKSAYLERALDLQQRLMEELKGEIARHVLYRHDFEAEKHQPVPVKTPEKGSK